MNINLLPKKNIRNVAPFYTLIMIIGIIVVASLLMTVMYIRTNMEVTKIAQVFQQQNLMLAEAEKEISDIRKVQAIDMQEKILALKKETIFFYPLLSEVDKKVEENENQMLKLDVVLPNEKEEEQATNNPEESKSLLKLSEGHILVSVVTESDNLTKVGGAIDKMGEISWVDEAHFLDFTVEKKESDEKVAKTNYSLDVDLAKLLSKGE